jgi:GH15 family glucan-1,4-alpha-glucosidase
MDRELYAQSVRQILASQSTHGSYIASPAFPTYQYCWLRDGSFIAHAMDRVGEYNSAAAFFRWVGRTIEKYSGKVEQISRYLERGQPVSKDDMLHTRYTLEGNEVNADRTWGNAQIDGYGTWLWALAEHVRLSGEVALLGELSTAIHLTLQYLELVWQLPGYDCWEEHPDFLHPYSLATVYSGFDSMGSLIRAGLVSSTAVAAEELARRIKEFIMLYGIKEQRLIKHIAPAETSQPPRPVPQSGVDASLIGVSIPYYVLRPDDPIMQATIQAIEADLHRPQGGVYRYRADVYYGGGEWLLLTAWLGWYYATVGKLDRAQALCRWIEGQADEQGAMPEQVSDYLLAPHDYHPWLSKWGPVAKPLTWSHAMYVILAHAIQENQPR